MSKPTVYQLYASPTGPTPHWQMQGRPRVRGCWRDDTGELHPPAPTWEVLARSVTEAAFFVRTSAWSHERNDGLGICRARAQGAA